MESYTKHAVKFIKQCVKKYAFLGYFELRRNKKNVLLIQVCVYVLETNKRYSKNAGSITIVTYLWRFHTDYARVCLNV